MLEFLEFKTIEGTTIFVNSEWLLELVSVEELDGGIKVTLSNSSFLLLNSNVKELGKILLELQEEVEEEEEVGEEGEPTEEYVDQD